MKEAAVPGRIAQNGAGRAMRAGNAVAILIGARGAPSPPPADTTSAVLSLSFAKDDVHGRATATGEMEEEREETDAERGEQTDGQG